MEAAADEAVLNEEPVATAAMLIRRPVAEVFDAFVDPAVTSRFWFTSGSGRLEPAARLRWEWAMYGAAADVVVRAVEPNQRILLDWGDPGAMTAIEWTFAPHGDDATFVTIENRGFGGSPDERVRQAIDGTEGFALVLAGAKAWLEHGLALNLVGDRHPAGVAA